MIRSRSRPAPTPALIRARLDEFEGVVGVRPDDAELAAIEAAIFIEDAFGVALTDDDLGPERLGDRDRVEGMLLGKEG